MATNTDGGTTESFSNTPQAVDDSYLNAQSNLTEDSSVVIYFDVMANDLGGKPFRFTFKRKIGDFD